MACLRTLGTALRLLGAALSKQRAAPKYLRKRRGITMRKRVGLLASTGAIGGLMILGGCAVQPPSGPTVMALPSPGKSLEAFQRDDYDCRNYAGQQTAYQSGGGTNGNPTANGAVLGTVAGAALGAAFGAVGGNAGAGAAIGAGTGLLGGAAVGNSRAAQGTYSLQQIYNIAYTQCMYSRGDSVRSPPPGYGYGSGYGPAGYPYSYPYAYAYPPLAYAPPVIGGGVVVFGGGGHGWWHH